MITTLLTLTGRSGVVPRIQDLVCVRRGVEIDRRAITQRSIELENLSPDPGECRFDLNQDGGVYLRLGSPPAFDVRSAVPCHWGALALMFRRRPITSLTLSTRLCPATALLALQRKSVSSQIIPKPLRSLSLIKRVFLQRMD